MSRTLKVLPVVAASMLLVSSAAMAQYGYTYDCVPGNALINGVCQPVPPAIGGQVATMPLAPYGSYSPYWGGGYSPYAATGWPPGDVPDYYYGR